MKRAFLIIGLGLVFYLSLSTGCTYSKNQCDVCVYGGTSGGVVAALQADRMGKKVILLEPYEHLGGLTTAGLSSVDIGNPASVGGIAREYFKTLAALYGRELKFDNYFAHTGVSVP